MEIVTGIFPFSTDGSRTRNRLREIGIAAENIHLVMPGASKGKLEATISVEDTEGPGVGTVLGAILGGAVALLVSPFFVPGGAYAAIGLKGVSDTVPVTAIVTLGAMIVGTVLGAVVENSMTTGVPHDDLFLYEEALRRGHSVLIATTEDREKAAAVRREFKAAGAQPLDAFGTSWWRGVRELERAYYEATTGKSFEEAEPAYRRGYEVALHRNYRGRSYGGVAQELHERHGDAVRAEDFRRGYERGQVTHASRSWWITSPAPVTGPTGTRPRSWWH